MKITGSYPFDAPVSQVWEKLMSGETLSGCIPGVQSFDPVGQHQYKIAVGIRVGPINGKYDANLAIVDQDYLKSCRLVADGKGPLGFAKGSALVTLEETQNGTLLKLDGDAEVGGAVARVGQRMMGSVAKTMMDRFFQCLREAVGTGTA